MTSSQILIKLRVISSVQLVNGELPDRVATGWTVQGITVTLVGHSKYKINEKLELCFKKLKSNNHERSCARYATVLKNLYKP